MKRAWMIISVLVPLAGLAAWLAQLCFVTLYGTLVVIPVTGYDPRDLLSGHYLLFRLDINPNPCSDVAGGERCVCFTPAADRSPAAVTWTGVCKERPGGCRAFLKGSCTPSSVFRTGLERYYFPEGQQKELARTPENARIEVRLDGSGGGIITDFFVEGGKVPAVEPTPAVEATAVR